MFKIIPTILILFSVLWGQVSVQITVGNPPPPRQEIVVIPQGYVDDYEPREDLVVISPNIIGFWVKLPSGRFVLHYRSTWYDDKNCRMYYGPWKKDHNRAYHNYSRYDDVYIVQHYPKYKRHGHDRENNDHKENKHHHGNH
jgi:hypothetical protein